MPEYEPSYIKFELSRGAPPPGGVSRLRVISTTGESGWLVINEEQYAALLTILTTPQEEGWHGYRLRVGDEVLAVMAKDYAHAKRIISDLRPGGPPPEDVTETAALVTSYRTLFLIIALTILIIVITVIVTNIVTSR